MSDFDPFGAYRRETAISRALLQEAYLAQSLLNAGMTAIRRLSYTDQGRAFEGFFGLANGVERLAKLILVSDYYARRGSFPSTKELKSFGHDLVGLLQRVELVAQSRGADPAEAPSEDARSDAAIQFLSRFALTDRYYNLNRLTQGDSPIVDDPLTRWVELVTLNAPKPRVRRDAEHQYQAFARRVDAEASVVVDFTGIGGNAIRSLEDATAQGFEDDWIGVHGVLLAARPLRFLARTVGKLNNAREPLPYFSEIFRDWLVRDSVLRRRRGFPRGRN